MHICWQGWKSPLVPGPLHLPSSPGWLLIITQGLARPLDPPGVPQVQICTLWKCALESKVVPEAVLTLIKAGRARAHTRSPREDCVFGWRAVLRSLLEGFRQDSQTGQPAAGSCSYSRIMYHPPNTHQRAGFKSSQMF